MKLPGLKFASRNHNGARIRSAIQVAEDNAVMSNPPPDPRDIDAAIRHTLKSIIQLDAAILRMLRLKRK